jgi:hypothetical protein
MAKTETAPLTKFSKDKPVVILAVLSGLLAFINTAATLARLKSHDFKVPVQYIANDGSVLQTSSWYTLYSLAIFSVLSAGVGIFIAHKLHKSSAVFATGLLIVQVVLSIVALLVSSALLGLVSRV